MKTVTASLPCLLAAAAMFLACGDPDDQGSTDSGTGAVSGTGGGSPAGTPVCDGGTEFTITDDNNYQFTNSLKLERSVLKDATNLLFDWGGISRDMFRQDIDAAEEVDTVAVALMGLTPDQIEEELGVDGDLTSFNKGLLTAYPDGSFTSQNLLDLTFAGNPVTPDDVWQFFDTSGPYYQFDPATHTFLVIAQTGTDLGKGARMMHMFTLDPNSTQTSLALSNTSTVVSYTAELETAQPVAVPLGEANLSIQWKQMTKTALGNDFQPTSITRAALAHFSMTKAELETNFLGLENLADGWWEGEVVKGTSIQLSTLTDAQGAPFSGITSDGLWLVALFCSKACSNPAPWSITFLEPCP